MLIDVRYSNDSRMHEKCSDSIDPGSMLHLGRSCCAFTNIKCTVHRTSINTKLSTEREREHVANAHKRNEVSSHLARFDETNP